MMHHRMSYTHAAPRTGEYPALLIAGGGEPPAGRTT